MKKVERYRVTLRELDDWDAFLLAESGLPGHRGNIELAQAVADEGQRSLFERYVKLGPEQAPTNTPEEFLPFCGTIGLGQLISSGDLDLLERLRELASDSRWRMREAMAMALQRIGRQDIDLLLRVAEDWASGNRLEQRAAVAGLAEPDVLEGAQAAAPILNVFDRVTASIEGASDRRSEDFHALRKGLGYTWSVVVAAFPQEGKERMERWLQSDNQDVRWVMRENLKKKRLSRMDPAWVAKNK